MGAGHMSAGGTAVAKYPPSQSTVAAPQKRRGLAMIPFASHHSNVSPAHPCCPQQPGRLQQGCCPEGTGIQGHLFYSSLPPPGMLQRPPRTQQGALSEVVGRHGHLLGLVLLCCIPRPKTPASPARGGVRSRRQTCPPPRPRPPPRRPRPHPQHRPHPRRPPAAAAAPGRTPPAKEVTASHEDCSGV